MHMNMDAKNSRQVNFIGESYWVTRCSHCCSFCAAGRAQLTPVVPLPDGLGESGLLVALGNMPKSKTAPLLVRIAPVQNLPCLGDFFIVSTVQVIQHKIRRRLRGPESRSPWTTLTSWWPPPTPTWTSCSSLQRVSPSYILASR